METLIGFDKNGLPIRQITILTDAGGHIIVIIEILSGSTRDYDRGTKFMLYRSIKTLQEYILIDSGKVVVEIFSRNADNSWQLREFKTPGDHFTIQAAGLTLHLQDIYDGISPGNELNEAAQKYNYTSREKYLEAERATESRNEYYDGHIITLPGTSLEHNTIEVNLVRRIGSFPDDSNCRMLPSHMRVTTPSHESYMYPDALIYCGKPAFEDGMFETLLNPVVVFEILSPSAKNRDKKRKFIFYREIPSLKEYIMIDSTKRSLIVVRRQPDDSWKFQDLDETDAALVIETIGFKLPLAEIYKGTGL